jgi:RNA polymerase sigma factor (sigma-70 family)
MAVDDGNDANAADVRAGQLPVSPVTAAFLGHSTFLKKFLTAFLPVWQDIEDVAQEAYLRAYIAERHECIEQPKAFLFRIAKNLALTRLSEKSRQITDYIEEAGSTVVIEAAASIDQEIEAQQCLGLYCEAVAALPEKCRQVFLFRKVHGLSHKEIAQRMGLSISSVEKYLRQGILACELHLRNNERPPVTARAEAPRGRGKARS